HHRRRGGSRPVPGPAQAAGAGIRRRAIMRQECIYIAGPMCFYADGYPRWYVMRDRAKVKGFAVSMPNDKELKLDHEDLRKNADTIFENCCDCMNASTAILCNLEFYRGADVDGGSLYEVGMAYAKG